MDMMVRIVACVAVLVQFLFALTVAVPQYGVEYKATAENGWASLKVTFKGPANDLKIILSDPEGNTVGQGFIWRDELADGVESEKVHLAGLGETPDAGTYTLIVKTLYPDREIYRKDLKFNGAKLSITKSEFKTEYLLGSWTVTKANLSVSNTGDLPAIIYKLIIKVDGEEESPPIIDGISPGEEKIISEPLWIGGLKRGKHNVVVELYSKDGKLLARHTSEILCGASESEIAQKSAGFEMIFAVLAFSLLMITCKFRNS